MPLREGDGRGGGEGECMVFQQDNFLVVLRALNVKELTILMCAVPVRPNL